MYLVKTNISHSIYKFIFKPFMQGIYGFLIFMVVDILIKIFIFFIHSRELFSIERLDIILSLLGFFAFFLIYVVQNLNYKRRSN